MPSDGAVVRELGFMGCLHGRNRGVFGSSDLDQLLCAPFLITGDVKMIADQEQEWVVRGKLAGAQYSLAVSNSSGLFDKDQPGCAAGSCRGIRRFVARTDHDADILNSGRKDLL